MPGLHNCAHRCRRTLAEHAAHHHACAPLCAIERAQQPLDAARRTIAAPRQCIGVEAACRQWVAHGADARRPPVGPAFVGHVKHHRDMAPARPAKCLVEPHHAGAARHGVPAVFVHWVTPLEGAFR